LLEATESCEVCAEFKTHAVIRKQGMSLSDTAEELLEDLKVQQKLIRAEMEEADGRNPELEKALSLVGRTMTMLLKECRAYHKENRSAVRNLTNDQKAIALIETYRRWPSEMQRQTLQRLTRIYNGEQYAS